MPSLEDEIKQLMIDVLQLEDITPADIESEAPLFVEGLGLDSIDALELGVAIQKRYGITLSANAEENRRHFESVRALAVAQAIAHFAEAHRREVAAADADEEREVAERAVSRADELRGRVGFEQRVHCVRAHPRFERRRPPRRADRPADPARTSREHERRGREL